MCIVGHINQRVDSSSAAYTTCSSPLSKLHHRRFLSPSLSLSLFPPLSLFLSLLSCARLIISREPIARGCKGVGCANFLHQCSAVFVHNINMMPALLLLLFLFLVHLTMTSEPPSTSTAAFLSSASSASSPRTSSVRRSGGINVDMGRSARNFEDHFLFNVCT
jgi:hypothetical protein